MKRFFQNTYLAFVFLILYLPIVVLIIFSFNTGSSVRNIQGWGLDAYAELFKQTSLWQALSVTLLVALISTIISVVIGTFAALGLGQTKKLTRNLTLGISNIPLVNADIVTAVALMMLFMSFAFNFGLATLILAHISFNIPYVIFTVLPKIKTINKEQLEASQDLGASSWYTIRKIVLPILKPAIIAGAAIAFAMSFDDFIISYFTGGSTANLSTYIYSLKRIKPYINALSTMIIVIIAFIIISWNTYKIAKKQLRFRNERIMNATYRDKRIIKLEKNLIKNYLILNKVKAKIPKKKINKTFLFRPISESEEFYYISYYENLIKNNKKIVRNILSLEKKINKEQVWMLQVKKRVLAKKRIKERRSRITREKFHFLNWPWKIVLVSLLVIGAFSGTLAFYVKSNNYDLTIANWGEYISSDVLRNFEKENNIKVKYVTYEDNETLYAKLATTDYDIMVPSDYMIAKLASEGRLEELSSQENKDKIKIGEFNSKLVEMMKKYKFEVGDDTTGKVEKDLSQYSIPYFWGDLLLVFNTKNNPNLLKELDITDIRQVNWDILKTAVDKNKRIVLNNDMHNLYMLGLVTMHYQNHWGENDNPGFDDYVNAHSNQEIDDVSEWLKNIIQNSHTKLQSDEIIDTVGSSKHSWDIAFMYNGDLLASMQQNLEENHYEIVRPYMGTNIWADNLVISKRSKNKDLAFKFINYIMQHEVQVELSVECGYTSPLQSAIEEVSEDQENNEKTDGKWKDVYIPGQTQIASPSKPVGAYNGLYKRGLDAYMQNQFNKLSSKQGGNNITALFVQLAVVLIIIVGFVGLMLWFR